MAVASMMVGTSASANMKPSMAPEPPLPRKFDTTVEISPPLSVTLATTKPKSPRSTV
ncbi:MAG: hypothetical protein V8T46_06515 [Sutterella seckii]